MDVLVPRDRDPATMELRPPRHRVSPRALWYWATRAAVGWLVIIAIQVAVLTQAHDGEVWVHLAVLAITIVVALVHLTVMPMWRYRVHRWEATDTAVYTQSGWLNQERRIAPISRVQTVDSERGPVEQLFKLANVTVTTASAAGPLKIHGLASDVADRLVDDLTTRVGESTGDAT